jgi:hypothetical protein
MKIKNYTTMRRKPMVLKVKDALTMREGDTLLDKRETADYLRISVPSVNNHLHNGLLVPTRIGGRVFFRKRTLDEFLRASELKGRREAMWRQKLLSGEA